MRRILLLCLIIVAAITSWPVSAATPENCTTNCTFLPLIHNPSPIQVHDVHWKPYRYGSLYRCGSIVNTLPLTISDVRLELQAFDLQHQLVMTATGSPNLPATIPGGLNGFCISAGQSSEPNPEYTYVVEVQNFSADKPSTSYAPLSVSDMREGALGFDDTEFLGTLRNDTQWTLRNIEVTGWINWDRNSGNPPGVFEAIYYRDIEKTELAPGETTAFSIRINGRAEFPPTPPITVNAVGEIVQP